MTRRVAVVLIALLIVTSVGAVAPVQSTPDSPSSPELADDSVIPSVRHQSLDSAAPSTPDNLSRDPNATNRSGDVPTRQVVAPQFRDNYRRQGSPLGTTHTGSVEAVIVAEPGQVEEVTDTIAELDAEVRTVFSNHVAVEISFADIENLSSHPGVRYIRPPSTPVSQGTVSEGVARMQADDLHAAGVTGDGATVVVFDQGFNPTNEKIEDQVIATKTFGGPGFSPGESGLHGTGSAEMVADVAPGADLILVSVGDEFDFINAVDWVESETEADVVTMSLGYLPVVGPLDGSDLISQRIAQSTQNGLVWVTSAGNQGEYHVGQQDIDDGYAGKHWHGEWEAHPNQSGANGGELLAFGTEYEYLLPMINLGGGSIFVSWDEEWAEDDERYAAHLYGYDPDGDFHHLAQRFTTNPVETFSLSDGYYDPLYLAIEKIDADGQQDFDVHTTNTVLIAQEYTVKRSLLIPATSGATVTVGAVDQADDKLRPYSSRGPTVDGRTGMSVVAPTNVSALDSGFSQFTGTSAAAPHVGGLAALLAGSDESLTGQEIRSALRQSGRGISGDETHLLTDLSAQSIGAGHVDGRTALTAVNPRVTGFTIDSTEVAVNESVNGTISAENNALSPLGLNVTVFKDGSIRGSEEWAIDGRDQVTRDFTVTFDSFGEHSVSVNDLAPKTVTVHRKSVKLNLSANTTSVNPGESVLFELQRADTDAAVDGNVVVQGEAHPTGTDGRVAVRMDETGAFDAIGTKAQTPTTTFVNDTLSITVGNDSSDAPDESTGLAGVRSLSSATVAPGGDVMVTLRTTANTSRIAFTESIEPAATISYEGLTIDGEAESPLSAVVFEDGLAVAVNGVEPDSNVTVRYSIGVSENVSAGTNYTISGTLTDDAPERLQNDTFTVKAGSPLPGAAGEADLDNDGSISDAELSAAISDWAAGSYTDSDLSAIISGWAAT